MPALNRSSYSAKSIVDLLTVATKTLDLSELTPEIKAILLNTSVAEIVEQIEGIVEPFYRKRSDVLTLTQVSTTPIWTANLSGITDYKRSIVCTDTTSKKIIEFKTEREFQNAQLNSSYNSTAIAYRVENTIYFYIPTGAGITTTTVVMDYVRQITKITANDLMGFGTGAGRVVKEQPVIISGGTNYVVGDIVRLATGGANGVLASSYTVALYRVTSVNSGAVTGLECIYQGEYSIVPTPNTTIATVTVMDGTDGTGESAGSGLTVQVKSTSIIDIPDEYMSPVINLVKMKYFEIAGRYQEAQASSGYSQNLMQNIIQAYPFNAAKREESIPKK